MLKSPIYAGAYAYGRRSEKQILVDGEIRTVRACRDPGDWVARIQGAHEGYITWEAHMRNLDKMRENRSADGDPALRSLRPAHADDVPAPEGQPVDLHVLRGA
jgi:hypothetical protein